MKMAVAAAKEAKEEADIRGCEGKELPCVNGS
jgi:hypothetical protein